MSESSKNKPHLLLVDDDKSLLRLLTIRLEGEGYQVTAVEDGNAALRKLQNDALPFPSTQICTLMEMSLV